ncbi:hypothetical protein MNBD_GAMMA22-894 [hydrothermal vent metagenome]|uniref:Uncharacterized protein n=1 Tax=hydrothermal vent metagenome TaxID=652676 RepID=A0A3B1ALP7_9ZZZZ
MPNSLSCEHKDRILEMIYQEIKANFEDNVETDEDLKKLTPDLLLYIRF